jgi:hypothetical protein
MKKVQCLISPSRETFTQFQCCFASSCASRSASHFVPARSTSYPYHPNVSLPWYMGELAASRNHRSISGASNELAPHYPNHKPLTTPPSPSFLFLLRRSCQVKGEQQGGNSEWQLAIQSPRASPRVFLVASFGTAPLHLVVPFFLIMGIKFCQSPHFIPEGFEAQLETSDRRGLLRLR